jgi:hypothetical protein
MPVSYSLSADKKFLIPSNGSLPKIKLGSGLEALDLNQFASALNRTLNNSPTAHAEMGKVATEGFVFYGANIDNTSQYKINGYNPLNASGFSVYTGYQIGEGTFKNTAAAFEIKAYLKIKDFTYKETGKKTDLINYDALAISLIYEGALCTNMLIA